MKQHHSVRQYLAALSTSGLVLIGTLAPAVTQAADALNAAAVRNNAPAWNATSEQTQAAEKLPTLNGTTFQQAQPAAGNQAEELNPQPLPPKKPVSGNAVKSNIGNQIQQQPALTQPATGINDKAGLKADAAKLPPSQLDINGRATGWNAAPAIKQPTLQKIQPGFGNQADDLNPQPLPPKKTQLNGAIRTTIGGGLKHDAAQTQSAASLDDKAGNIKASVIKSPKNLFDMEDRAIIIVSGKQTTAGAAKKAIYAEIAAKAGPPTTVKGGARKLDLAALNVTNSAVSGQPAPQKTMEGSGVMGNKPGGIKPLIVSQSAEASRLSSQVAQSAPSAAFKNKVANISVLKCPGNGPPTISEVEGRLKPGGKVTLWGSCFGDRAGRVEIIGQFPGGKLKPAFTAWDMNGVELEIPANIRGATDHTVAVSIVTADGKTSAAMPAQFIAARERVEVPERLWSPSARFELAATGGATAGSTDVFGRPVSANPAYSGQISKSLRVNPQCWLDNLDAIILSGGISQFSGWEQGPPNEGSVAIDWVGTCVDTTTTTYTNYVITTSSSSSTSRACRVAFQVRAWAYCPVGVSP